MTDAAACETHLTEAGTLAFRVALSVLRHREDAEDVAQEAVVRSLQRFNSLRDRSRFRSWLVRITWRLALDRRRHDTRRSARDFHLVSAEHGHGTAEHDLIQRERARRLRAAIDDLPADLRLPLVLATIQGHSVEEVASLLDLPVGTVKSRSFKARRRLKSALIGTGVISAVIATVVVMTWPQLAPAGMPVMQSPTTQSPVTQGNVAAVPRFTIHAPSPVALPAQTAAAAEIAPPADIRPVVIPTIEIPIVDTRVVRLPTVRVPVVGVHSIEIPTVKVVSSGLPETHPEKQR